MERIIIKNKNKEKFRMFFHYQSADCKSESEYPRTTLDMTNKVITHLIIVIDIAANLHFGVSSQSIHCKPYELRPVSRNSDLKNFVSPQILTVFVVIAAIIYDLRIYIYICSVKNTFDKSITLSRFRSIALQFQ